jgi:hypothetical protein
MSPKLNLICAIYFIFIIDMLKTKECSQEDISVHLTKCDDNNNRKSNLKIKKILLS